MTELGRAEETVALEFRNDADLLAALEVIFHLKQEHIPYAPVGRRTMIVPRSKKRYFERWDPTERKVVSAADVSPEEISRLRRENLGLRQHGKQGPEHERKAGHS